MRKRHNESMSFPKFLGIEKTTNRRLIWILRSILYTSAIYAFLFALYLVIGVVGCFVLLSFEFMMEGYTNLVYVLGTEEFRLVFAVIYIICLIISLVSTYNDNDDNDRW